MPLFSPKPIIRPDASGFLNILRTPETEIPAVFFKRFIIYLKAKGIQVFDGKNCCGSGVSLSKRMYLPDVCNESCQVIYFFFHCEFWIIKCFFMRKVVIKRLVNHISIGIKNWLTVNITFCSFVKIFLWSKSVYLLQANRSLPQFAFFLHGRFWLEDVWFKVYFKWILWFWHNFLLSA